MTGLDNWLEQATRGLSKESAAQVRNEIQEHYESARQAAIDEGAAPQAADGPALAGLGDAKTANRQYKRALLTSAEAELLREANWEARAICSRPWLKGALIALPVTLLLGAVVLFMAGALVWARVILGGAIVFGASFSALFLPVHTYFYTRSRHRAYLAVKWAALTWGLILAVGPGAPEWTLFIAYTWLLGWIEATRAAIRRKLPVEKWPKQLYF